MNASFVRGSDRLAASAHAYFVRLDRAVAGRRLVVWGAGRAGALAVELLAASGRTPALVVDRDARRHGQHVGGVQVCALDNLIYKDAGGGDYVLLASMHAPEMAAWLAAKGWQRDADFATFPLASIYRPEFGFALDELPVAPPPAEREASAGRNASAEREPFAATIFASEAGNFYFRELRDFLVCGLRRFGWTVHAANEEARHVDGVPIVVGPHEFFSVGRGVEWLSPENLRHAVLVTTEQPQSLWFQAFERALALAGAVVDLSPAACEALASRGVPATWLPLGWYSDCGVFDRGLRDDHDDVWEGRDIDVLFIGSHSPRRARWLDELRRALPNLSWHVHLPSDASPLAGRDVVDTATSVALARRSKVLLNIHRDDTPYFEWQRIVWRGLWQRTLVVTEPSGTVPGLAAGRHYVEVPVAQMARALRSILAASHESDDVRRAGYRAGTAVTFARTEAVLAAAVRQVCGT